MFGNKIFVVYSAIYYLHIIEDSKNSKISQLILNIFQIAKIVGLVIVLYKSNKKININLLVFTKIRKSMGSVIAMHHST